MNKYTLELSKSSLRFLQKCDRVTKERIINVIHALVENPYSYFGSIKLIGYENVYRIRVGKYRIIYQIQDEKLIINIQDINSRGDVYKRL
ncbi:type II toxin-antitoxin system RelE family toxin [Bacillus sp. FJAT-29937]|uniref:type II toxin-antitoxin system RelE family toxin n=1 Tax=Bacillus sp. FJAT-29937 TaxID=1720553 RepID=UPI0008350887|nr:type II toxin-antitoxin system RelE/ParE family toxin [Bacillus sp. FJAT-29937]